MKERDYIDRLFDSVNEEKVANYNFEDDHEDELLDMQIDFADKYLPSDKEDTKRRINADASLSMLLIANKREAFRDGFKAAEKLFKTKTNKLVNQVNNDLNYDLEDIRFELSQIQSVLNLVTDFADDIFPTTDDIDNISNSLHLLGTALSRTYNRFQELCTFSSPNAVHNKKEDSE